MRNHLCLQSINDILFYFSDYRTANGYERAMDLMDDEGDDSQNVQSDIDSQV